ncbi:MAG: hypothetical protein JNM56_07695 [Planctomycetia bacterium]|nr:hypothetical protein [Planctomycetia bacterium]
MSDLNFAEALKQELRNRGVSFDQGELLEFVEDVWTGVKRNPDVSVWADRFANGVTCAGV